MIIDLFNTLFSKSLPATVTDSKLIQMERAKNSKVHRPGNIFGVRSKSDFTDSGVKGFIITSKKSLIHQHESITHFTPNVYRYGAYSDTKRTFVKGFKEENLKQINTFVVDVDTKDHNVPQILLACIDDSIGAPSFILETDKGYQIYFVLSEPVFITNMYDFASLKVAKMISKNIKRSLQSVEADLNCNDFGFFRVPKISNLVHSNIEQTYDFKDLMNWSIQQSDDLMHETLNNPLYRPKGTSQHTQSDWFTGVLKVNEINSAKGKIGRNNTIFTMSLACYSDSLDINKAHELLSSFNARLTAPLDPKEILTIVISAYSGNYSGPTREYINSIRTDYVPTAIKENTSLGFKIWHHHRKTRENRKRSHYSEWENDIISFLKAQNHSQKPFIWLTQKELSKATGIPSSSLNDLLKSSKRLLTTKRGKGRGAITGWTTVRAYFSYILKTLDAQKSKKAMYRTNLHYLVKKMLVSIQITAAYKVLYNAIKLVSEKTKIPLLVHKETG